MNRKKREDYTKERPVVITSGYRFPTYNLKIGEVLNSYHCIGLSVDIQVKNLSEIIANQGFSIALSILLIFRIDRFMQEIIAVQKELDGVKVKLGKIE